MDLLRRKTQLNGLLAFLKECEQDIAEALRNDLGRPEFEATVVEIGPVRSEISYTLAHLESWLKPQSVVTPLVSQPGRSWIQYQPLGRVLVISPWNYPFKTSLSPICSLMAAGNQIALKPSEHALSCAHLLANQLPRYVDIEVHTGDSKTAKDLLEQQWDHIVFTGDGHVGRLVYQKAASNLTPVTLELGGKCPAIVDESASLTLSARRIIWGKMLNAGQTCVAPDYVLVHESLKDELIKRFKKSLRAFFGEQPRESSHFGRIINGMHVKRLAALLEGADVIHGGEFDVDQKYVAPTLVNASSWEHPLMQEEIFGPILPVMSYREFEEALALVNKCPKPLAIYCFSANKKLQDKILENTSSGAVCFNDVVSQAGIYTLPFGGVGASGIGAYHGKFGFERFSHARAIYSKTTAVDIPLRYPPYTNLARKVASWL